MKRLLGIVLVGLVAAPVIAMANAPSYDRFGTVSAGEDELLPRRTFGYRSGRKIPIDVVTIGWAEVEVRTAQAFLAMREAAAADGVTLWIRSGFRDHETQTWLYQAWRAGYGNKAAKPGYSNHQSGRALDIDLNHPGSFEWLEANGRRFGFRRTVAGEPWHWEFVKKPKKKLAKKVSVRR